MGHLSLILRETLSPLGSVDELYSKLVEIIQIKLDDCKEQSIWLEGASDGLCRRLDVVDPMESDKADYYVELRHIFELGV